MTDQAQSLVGRRVTKHGAESFLTGHARFVGDITLPRMVHLAILRSPHAHARIRSIDTTLAVAAPSVLRVLVGTEAAERTDPIPYLLDPSMFGGRRAEVRCLATSEVTYQGQPVAAVVAEDRYEARAALGLIKVEYEPLPFVLQADDALRRDAPISHEGWEDNVLVRGQLIEGDPDGALAKADFVLEEDLVIQRYGAAPIEPRGYLASWDPVERRLTLYATTQNPHPLRTMLAQSLRLAEHAIRVVAPNIGGSFGLKMPGHPEEVLVCLASLIVERPVRWIERRHESLLVGSREQSHHFTVGFNADGKVLAMRDRIHANVGAVGAMPGWMMARLTQKTIPSGYRIQNVDVEYVAVQTNKAPWNATRGYGKEAAVLVMERIMQLVARRLAIDPAEVRRRNFVRPDEFPYRTAMGLRLDSGDYAAVLEKALTLAGYDELRAEQERARTDGRYLGIGIAFEVTPEGGGSPGTLVANYDTTTVRMDPSGMVTVLTGVTTPGGGNDTGIAQLVAEELGLPLESIRVVQGDTDLCPYGFGNFSGRSMLVGGSSAVLAARSIADLLKRAAGVMLGASPTEFVLARGQVASRDRGKTVPVRSVAHAIFSQTVKGVDPPVEATRTYRPGNIDVDPDEKGRVQPYPTYSNGAFVAVVEVDARTGVVRVRDMTVVHDCGTMINPLFVEGQSQGGATMGIGGALFEELVYDGAGHLIADNFKAYLMPRAPDVPSFKLGHLVTPSPFTLLGNKGAGEAGVGGAVAAVVNAVEDALSPFGVTVRRLPLSPPRVLELVEAARR